MDRVFDLLVIGAGSGGIATARRAAQYGAKVGIIEGSRLGGTCVNVGCVPKKVMFNTASIAETLHEASEYGFTVAKPEFDWATVKSKRDAYVQRLNGIYERNLLNSKVEIIGGIGSFVNNHTVRVGQSNYSAKHILIATGSQATIPKVQGSEHVLTSDGFFKMDYLPKKVAIVGAGYIAVELAGVLAQLGSKVDLYFRHDELLRSFDSSIREGVLDSYKELGMKLICNSNIHKIESVQVGEQRRTLTLHSTINQSQATVVNSDYDEVIYAVGREGDLF